MTKTFLNCKVIQKHKNADFTIFGIETYSAKYLNGTKKAAPTIRKLSQIYANNDGSAFPIKIYNPDKKYLLNGIQINDFGSIKTRFKKLESKIMAAKPFDLCSIPIFIGGDHAVTYAITKNISKPFTLIHCDAHGDCLADFEEDPHGSVMHEVQKNPYLDKIIHLGLRGNLNTGPGLSESINHGNVILTRKLLRQSKSSFYGLIDTDNIYISIDTDFFDPSIAVATNYPEHDGVLYDEAIKLFQHIIQNKRILGIDIVEYNPDLDVNNITGLLLTNVIIEIMYLIKKYGAS